MQNINNNQKEIKKNTNSLIISVSLMIVSFVIFKVLGFELLSNMVVGATLFPMLLLANEMMFVEPETLNNRRFK